MFIFLISATILGTFTTEMSLVATVVAWSVEKLKKQKEISLKTENEF